MSGGPRLVLALPFTVAPETGCLRLLAGEDVRYTFRRPGIEGYGAALVETLRAPGTRHDVLAALPEADRAAAGELLERLCAERLVSEVRPEPPIASYVAELRGAEPLARALRDALGAPPTDGPRLAVLCQDTLDYGAALAFQREVRHTHPAWLWVSEGPRARGIVSPVFLASGGPCLGCLLAAFRRLSPAPELYDALRSHGEAGGAFVPSGLDEGGRALLARVAALKVQGLAAHDRPASTFALHVLERATLELTVHPLAVDPDCEEHTP